MQSSVGTSMCKACDCSVSQLFALPGAHYTQSCAFTLKIQSGIQSVIGALLQLCSSGDGVGRSGEWWV